MKRRSVRSLAVCGLLAGAGLAGFAPGCKKDDAKSLVIVDMEVKGGDGTGVAVVEVSIGYPDPSTEIAVKKDFDLPATGLPTSRMYEVGVWVPSGVTGSLPVTAVAKPVSGCAGYVGMRYVKVPAGGTSPIVVTMNASADVCTVTGTAGTGGAMGMAGSGGTMGMGGTGGSTGTAGTGGSTPPGSCGTMVGSPPPTVATPTLNNCVEYDSSPSTPCDPVTDTNNAGIVDMAVSPDGQFLATSTNNSYFDGVVKIWKLQGGTPTQCGPTFTKANRGPGFVAFSPDGQFFAIAWNGDYVYIYRVPTFGQVGMDSRSPNSLYGVGFSADSQTLFYIDYVASDGTLYADHMDGSAITMTALGVDPDFMAVAPTAVGGVTSIAVAGYNANFGAYGWNGSVFSGPVVKSTVGTSVGERLAFSRSGTMLAEGTDDATVRIWNLPITANSAPVGTAITLPGKPFGIAFSAAGDQLATGSAGEVDLWDVATHAFVARHNVTPPAGGTNQFVDSTAFSASGGALFVGEDQCNKFLICQ